MGYPAKHKAVLNAHNEQSHVFYHAPTLIIASNVPQYQNGVTDCALGLQNIFLAARSMGLGSCWINQPRWLSNNDSVRDLLTGLGLPREHVIYGAAAVGLPAQNPPAPSRKQGTTLIVRCPHPLNDLIFPSGTEYRAESSLFHAP